MDSTKSLEDNLDDFKRITVSLANIDEKINDENQAIIILNSLPESYKDLKSAIKYGRESLSLDDVLGALRSRDLEIKIEKRSNGERLQVRGRNQKRDKSKGRGKSRSQSKRRNTCWNCHKDGHIRRFCPARKKNNDQDQADTANISDGFHSADVLTVATDSSHTDWVMDSGCTFHMTPRRDWLYDFRKVNGGKVLMGNDNACEIIGIGSVKFRMWDGSYKVLENVRLVPKLRRNLVSLGMLDASGCSYRSENGVMKALKGAIVVLKGVLKHGLYIL